MINGVVIGFFCFLLFLLHIFVFHSFNIKRRFYVMLKIFFLLIPVYTILFFLISERQMQTFITFFIPVAFFDFLNGAFLHFVFFYSYLHLIQVIDRSPTTRIMVEIEGSAQKKLNLEQIKQLYSIDRKITNELEDMVVLGYLSKESSLYANTRKGKIYTKIFRFIRNYLRLRRN